jgi:magnesium-transporting ATPase (P-type)
MASTTPRPCVRRPPRPKDAPLLDRRLLLRAYLRLGGVQAFCAMTAYLAIWAFHGVGLEQLRQAGTAIIDHAADPALAALQREATSAALATIVVCQMGNLFACRSERLSAFSIRGRNPLLKVGLAVEAILLLAVLHLPPLQRVFATAPLPALAWPALLLGPLLLLAVDEAAKWVGRRRAARRAPTSVHALTAPR